jgi:hypothetical protein
MNFVDISVKDFSGNFTHKAKAFDVKTQILLKTPAWSLTTVRLLGTTDAITQFLRTLPTFTEALVQMHVGAAKTLTEDSISPGWKNRSLVENRRK